MGDEALFPLLQRLSGEKVVVIGGGTVAERKVHALLDCGACITAIAPSLTPSLTQLVARGAMAHLARPYRAGDLTGAALAFVATGNPGVSRAAAEEARELRIPVNVVDQPELCTFVVPAVVRRGRLTIAVSTAGASPAWARRIKERLAEVFGEEYERLFEALAVVRRRCQERLADPVARRQALERLADDSLIELARSCDGEVLVTELWQRVTQEGHGHVAGKPEP